MATMDIFNSDAFSMRSLTRAINRMPYVPQTLGSLPIFTPKPVTTRTVMLDDVQGRITIIPVSERGDAGSELQSTKGTARGWKTFRIHQHTRIWASEIEGIRARGSESELTQVVDIVTERSEELRRNIELTHENMRLSTVTGIMKDYDGSTLVNWHTAFGGVAATEVDYDLDNASPASGAIRKLCNATVRAAKRAAQGGWTPSTYLLGLCGDTFWDQITAAAEVRQTYLNTQEAKSLREGNAWESFKYGGITFTNYQGTDDGTTVAVPTGECKFFPVNSPDCFDVAWSPHEAFDTVNTRGLPLYMRVVPDKDDNEFVDIKVWSYPLFICNRPKMLQFARNT